MSWRRKRAKIIGLGLPCEMCGARATELHHIIPLADGGGNLSDNLQPLCKGCHSRVTDGFAKTRARKE